MRAEAARSANDQRPRCLTRRTTRYTYDELGRKKTQTDPNGDTTRFQYDLTGRLVDVRDANGNQTHYTYNDADELVMEQVANGAVSYTRQYQYDVTGLRVSETDRDGRVTVYSYDDLARPWCETWYLPDATGTYTPTRVFITEYDLLGHTTRVYDSNYGSYDRLSDSHYTYDALDRRTSETITNAGAPQVILTTDYGTRADGLRTGFSAEIAGMPDFQNTYDYDALLRLTDIQQQSQYCGNSVPDKHVTISYDTDGRFKDVKRYAALDTSNLVVATHYKWDNDGRIDTLEHALGPNGDTLLTYGFNFDAAGRLISENTPDGIQNFYYDADGQVTEAKYIYQPNQTYTYDHNGNRQTADGTGYVIGPFNRVLDDGVYTYGYDPEGNCTSRTDKATGDVTQYTWDNRNRLVRSEQTVLCGMCSPDVVDYVYDALDRRIASLYNGADEGYGIRRESYIWDGKNVALDFVDDDGAGANPPALKHRYLWGAAVDQLMAQDNVGTPDETVFPLADHLGTTHDLADSSGTIVSHFTYDTFGNATATLGTITDTRYLFTGQEYDPATAIYYYDARWYNPKTGRFQSEDPSGFKSGDVNLGRYVENAPTMATDPSGEAGQSISLHGGSFWYVRGPSAAVIWGTGDRTRAHYQHQIGTILGGYGRSDWTGSYYLNAGSKVRLDQAFGGFNITEEQLDRAIAGANRYWQWLSSRDHRTSLSQDQYEQALRVFLQASKDGLSFDKEYCERSRAYTADSAAIAEWQANHADLCEGLPLIGGPATKPVGTIERGFNSEEEGWCASVINGYEDDGFIAGTFMPGGGLDLAATGLGGFAGVGPTGKNLRSGSARGSYARFRGTPSRRGPAPDNYRGRYLAARHTQGKARLPDDWDVHHRIPQEYMGHPELRDFDFHQPSNLQGVKGPRADVNIHQQITNDWADFRTRTPTATRAQIEAFAREMDAKYMQYWWK